MRIITENFLKIEKPLVYIYPWTRRRIHKLQILDQMWFVLFSLPMQNQEPQEHPAPHQPDKKLKQFQHLHLHAL